MIPALNHLQKCFPLNSTCTKQQFFLEDFFSFDYRDFSSSKYNSCVVNRSIEGNTPGLKPRMKYALMNSNPVIETQFFDMQGGGGVGGKVTQLIDDE